MTGSRGLRSLFRRSPRGQELVDLDRIELRLDRIERLFGEQAGSIMLQAQLTTNRTREEADAVRAYLELLIHDSDEAVRAHAQLQAELLNEQSIARINERLDRLERRIKRASTAPAPATGAQSQGAPAPTVAAGAAAPDIDYEALEEAFRGSSTVVSALQRQYVDDIEALSHPELPVLDIGCGRGEFVSMVAEAGAVAYGVDLDSEFIANGVDAGLDVRLEDAIAHLGSLETASLRAVCSFHLVEHLPIGSLVELLAQSARVVVPGGAIILETPNPENLSVGAHRFWLDPTHLKPIPPMLLDFLVTQAGFEAVEVRRLNRSEPVVEVDSTEGDTARLAGALNDVLAGPADYAVIGRRPTDD